MSGNVGEHGDVREHGEIGRGMPGAQVRGRAVDRFPPRVAVSPPESLSDRRAAA